MRKDPFTVGNYVHVFNRGNRKMPIVHNESDQWRFLEILRYFNDEYSPQNIFRKLQEARNGGFIKRFERPNDWPLIKPLVKILSFCLMPNHFHLLLKEITDSGISKFMKKCGNGFTNYSNTKYGEVGRIFQGSYRARVVENDNYLQYLDVYIQIVNPMELYPGGIEKALAEFDKAFAFAADYSFSSLPDTLKKRDLFITDRDILRDWLNNLSEYKDFARSAVEIKNIKEALDKLAID